MIQFKEQEKIKMSKKILLIDTSSAFHKFYHGYPDLMDEYGNRVEAIRGYAKFIGSLYKNFDFDEIVHVLDSKSDYRIGVYPDYKKNRAATEPELASQKEMLPSLLNTFNQKYVQISGFESDDILGTLAHRHSERGDIVLLFSQDKDLLQTVNDGSTAVLKYGKDEKGYNVFEHVTEEEIMKKYGVRPDQIADFLAIVGDSADNIKGVYKAGPAAAQKLLAEFNDVETIIAKSSTIPGKLGENVRNSVEDLMLSRKLTALLKDVPVPEIADILIGDVKLHTTSFLEFADMSLIEELTPAVKRPQM